MAARSSFYVIIFTAPETGLYTTSRTFATLRAARRELAYYKRLAADAAIYSGGPGGIRVGEGA